MAAASFIRKLTRRSPIKEEYISPSWTASGAGSLLVGRTLMAQPFDAVRGQMTGEAFRVAEGVSATTNGSYDPVSVSETGVLLYQTSSGAAATQLTWYDRGGKPLEIVATAGSVLDPAISPDERFIAFSRDSG